MVRFRMITALAGTPLLLQIVLVLPWMASCNSFMHSDVAVQLETANFTSALHALDTEQICLVEFYASWCPACKHFAPTFEKFAKFLKDKRLGGRLLYIARVDCASEAELCGQFDIQGYPSLNLGRAADFAGKQAKQLVTYKGHDRELPHLAAWVGEYFKTELKYSEAAEATLDLTQQAAKAGGAHDAAAHGSSTKAVTRRPLPNGPEWSLADVEGATVQLWKIVIDTPSLHTGADKREALRGILQGWAAAHPSPSCKSWAVGMAAAYDSLWPAREKTAPAAVLHAQPCGPPEKLAFQGEWVTCRGSQPDSRGFSCGLWEMIHTMALRLPDKPGAEGPAQAMMTFLALFNTHFFMCAPCQKHFGRLLASPEAAAVTDRRALVLWLWRVHNEVNERLRGIETKYGHSTTGDPAFPKEQWPAPESCSACRSNDSSSVWNEDQVYSYLQRVYGVGSVAGADGVKLQGGSHQLQLGQGARVRHSSLSSMLPVFGVLTAALLLFVVLRSTLGSHRRGRGPGGGVTWQGGAK